MKRSIRHARTPKEILENGELHSEAVRIYSLMALWVFQGNVCKRGLRYFAKCIGKSPATAMRRVQELVSAGLVKQGADGRGRRAYYVLLSPLYGEKQRALDAGESTVEDLVSFPRRRLATVRKTA